MHFPLVPVPAKPGGRPYVTQTDHRSCYLVALARVVRGGSVDGAVSVWATGFGPLQSVWGTGSRAMQSMWGNGFGPLRELASRVWGAGSEPVQLQ